MRVVLQRVAKASVSVDGQIVGAVDRGIMALIGVLDSDDEKVIDYILEKIINLRIFEDENDKMNLSLTEIKGELLIVPNFTLYGDCRKGRRPGFSAGAAPTVAEGIFQKLVERAKLLPVNVAFGQFQAHMLVELVNDGPVTLLLDSEKSF